MILEVSKKSSKTLESKKNYGFYNVCKHEVGVKHSSVDSVSLSCIIVLFDNPGRGELCYF